MIPTRRRAALWIGLLTPAVAWVGLEAGDALLGTRSPPAAPPPRPEAPVTPKTDIDQLARLVSLPRRPLSARWETRPLGVPGGLGPSDWELVAVLRFAPDDLEAVLAACPPAGEIPAPAWLPAGLAPTGGARDAASLARPPLAGGVLLPAGDAWVLRLHTT